MINSLQNMVLQSRGMTFPENEKWLTYLSDTNEVNVNFERLNSLENLTNNLVLKYVEKTLLLLDGLETISSSSKRYIEETLKWSEVAKCGNVNTRNLWLSNNFNLYAHNIGSAQIFTSHHVDSFYSGENVKIVSTLIKTHGLIGQYLKGEVSLSENMPLYLLVKNGTINEVDMKEILYYLNYCIIAAVSQELWEELKFDVEMTIDSIILGNFKDESIHERFFKLRKQAIKNGENFLEEYNAILSSSPKLKETLERLNNKTFWFVDASLSSFGLEDFLKTMTIIALNPRIDKIEHIDFSNLMKNMYYDFRGQKKVNIYKKRIIENFLSQYSLSDMVDMFFNEIVSNHLSLDVDYNGIFKMGQIDFKFSLQSSKLIEFCEVVEDTDYLYDKAIILLFDLFGLRRDEFDRLHNEDNYLETMNQNVNDKKKMLEHVCGDTILDIGPGGGILLDLLEKEFPSKNIQGIDISENVIQELEKKKNRENHNWSVIKGDAFSLSEYFKVGTVDTIIFSSVLHELFSFVPYEGKKFNIQTVVDALKSAYEILPSKGRIIIRDGIMSEPVSQNKIIEFINEEDMKIFDNYVRDFKGRIIQYEKLNERSIKLPVNDAMEFLYTYTWGKDAYPHEVKEQFGYLTLTDYVQVIQDSLKNSNVLLSNSYLQKGYEDNLLQKVSFYNEDYSISTLPDSTCFIVIEKQ